jgi:4'-phosphopantetheinyl transferase
VLRTSRSPGIPLWQAHSLPSYRVAVAAAQAQPTGWMARGEHELPSTNDWLTRRESTRADELRFTKRRSEYLLRRWVCKQAVSVAAGLSGELTSLPRIEVGNRPSGAPVVYVDGELLGLDVSLTDRAGWAVCVVGEDLSRVGCDLEIVEPRSAGFVSDFLTAQEQAYVASRPVGDRDVAANLIWSAKESALKVLRTGLRRDTRSVEVALEPDPTGSAADNEPGWARLEVRTAEGGLFPGWWRRDGQFLVTVASEEARPAPQVLTGSADLSSASPVHSWVGRPLSP